MAEPPGPAMDADDRVAFAQSIGIRDRRVGDVADVLHLEVMVA